VPHPVTGLPVVGMIGAGQLARMTQEAAGALGLTLAVLAERAEDGAALVTPDLTLGAPDDADRVLEFAGRCDVVTFDHEHVPADLVRAIEAAGTPTRPGAAALVHAQDKKRMRESLSRLGLPVPDWAVADGPSAVARFAGRTGWPVVVKRPRGGYDGRGVFVAHGPGDVPDGPWPLLVEELVAVRRELAAVLARRPSGQLAAWPVVETVQRDGVCVEVLAPAPDLPADTAQAALEIATRIAVDLDVAGVLAVELFETSTGLLVNELAMRPHNSGHWSIDGAVTSQFEQHLRAVLDWPLGDPSPRAPWIAMVNVLGGHGTDLAAALPVVLGTDPGLRVHLYGKLGRPGRKLGHVTAFGPDLAVVRERARRGAARLTGEAT